MDVSKPLIEEAKKEERTVSLILLGLTAGSVITALLLYFLFIQNV